jgi:hypothetical protein
MSRNLTQAAKGAGQVTDNINGVAEAAQNNSRGASDSQKAAQQLAKMSTDLRALVDQFKIENPRPGSSRGSADSSPRRQGSPAPTESREEIFTR